MSAVLKFVAAALLMFGLAALGWALMYFVQERHIVHAWPRAEATVVDAQVVEHKAEAGPLYAGEIQFAFSVKERSVTGIYVFPHESTSRERKEKQLARYPVGSRHTIAYDPESPAHVYIRPGYNVEFFVIPVFLGGVAVLFAIASAAMLVAARYVDRRAMQTAA